MEKESIPSTARKRKAAEQAWLHYYNRVLLENGLITRQEHSRMSAKIDERGR